MCDDGCIGRGHKLRQLPPLTALGVRCTVAAQQEWQVCRLSVWNAQVWLEWLDTLGKADRDMLEMASWAPAVAQRDL